jgi:hypothetical protein
MLKKYIIDMARKILSPTISFSAGDPSNISWNSSKLLSAYESYGLFL